jgi:hypothetical protein
MTTPILFGSNILETSTVTVTTEAATGPRTRLYDRDRGPQWSATTAANQDIDLERATTIAASGLAIINHNITGLTVTLSSGASFPPGTTRATVVIDADPFFVAFAEGSDKDWRVHIAAPATPPVIGELLIGTPRTIAYPFIDHGGTGTLGNVSRDRSPGGYRWGVKRGAKRVRLPWAWRGMTGAELTALLAAYDDIDQGAKNLLVRDELGVLRWMSCEAEAIEPTPITSDLFAVDSFVLEEAL